jgi:hypothetical protein
VAVDQHETVLLGPEDVILVPPAHDADAGFDRRAREVGQLLPCERQRNEGAAAIAVAEPIGQLQKQPREP